MKAAFLLLALALAECADAQFAQGPSINPGGVVNAASYGASVAPGSIAAVFGDLLVNSPTVASRVPLPIELAQLSLLFGEEPAAPLFFASSAQTNIQVPWELDGHVSPALTGSFNGLAGTAQPVDLVAYAPGIFTTNNQGTGQGAILDPSYRLVDANHPAAPGITALLIYCTGLGTVTSPPATGSAAEAANETLVTPTVLVGGVPAPVLYSGLAPGFVGAYQVNVLTPAHAPAGIAVPVTISMGGSTSNIATIAVQAAAAGQDSDSRADALLAQMTQDEKIQLLHGIGGPVTQQVPLPRGGAGYVPGIQRLGIPSLYLADGSVGLGNGVGPATALPSSIASAASWDPNLAYRYGTVIGSEMRAYGMNVNLGGNVNLIGREPRDGRTFETKGEDPILAGRITAAHLRAIQDQHVIGGIKHFALNDQETWRTSTDARIDERAARETDLLAFEIGIKDSNVQSVMCSYNLVNGTYACENPHLLNEVLKRDWGFKGFVMSDWWATHSTATAAVAGLDQEQPNPAFFGSLKQAIASGQVPQSRLDDMAHRILRAMFEAGLFDHPESLGPIDSAVDQAIAQQAEEQGAVLLKNAGGQLPLNAGSIHSIAVIGSHADIGVLSGGGSAQVSPTGGAALSEQPPCPPCWGGIVWDPSSPLAAIRTHVPNAVVQFDSGTDPAKAAALAATAEVAIVFVSEWTSEGMDSPDLNFEGQDALVAAVAGANPHTVVVAENGGPQVMPWLAQVSAVLEAWFPGQRGGEAIANLLFGVVNPSGKLPITFPAGVADLPRPTIPAPPDGSSIFPVNYSEGLKTGYKWFDANQMTPLFPFGFGLSYTTFAINNAKLADRMISNRPGFDVTFDLRNTGSVAGAEVAQVYLGLPAAVGEPPRRLVGWQKVLLSPGALQHVTISVDEADSSHPLSYWDEGTSRWLTAPGTYTVYLGNSSANLSVAGAFQVSQ